MQLSVYNDVQQRYQTAIDTLVEKLQQDRYILAAIMFGSLARGEGWAKSNVDLIIIREDSKDTRIRSLWLTEEDVIIEARVVPRNVFKRELERSMQGTPAHSIRTLSKLLFCKDDAIAEWYNETDDIGARDQASRALVLTTNVIGTLRKAQKWLYARNDPLYSFVWIMFAVGNLALIEMVLHGKAPAREAIQQAMAVNPTFFKAVYADLIDGPKDPQSIGCALQKIDHYLEERAHILFAPALDYLAQSEEPCSISDIGLHFQKRTQLVGLYGFEWLVEKGIIEKLSSPIRLSKKSSVELQQQAYYFNADTFDWATWQPPPYDLEAVKQRFQPALGTLTEKLIQDRYVEALILFGSLSRGDFWAKSDVDLMLVMRDDIRTKYYYSLTENGINFEAFTMTRGQLKQVSERALQGSWSHSVRSQCTILFSRDDALSAWHEESAHVEARDQEIQVLRAASSVPYLLRKANKWLVVRNDVHYCLVWILNVVNALASVEVILNGEAPSREVIHQALKYNPEFFNIVYTNLIEGPKTERAMRRALDLIDTYLTERTEIIFKPILDYLLDAQEPRTASDLDAHFQKQLQGDSLYGFAYEWLVDKGIVDKLSVPIHLTKKSQVTVDEAAYFYDEDEPDWNF